MIRNAVIDDIPSLTRLWMEAFGDDEKTVKFFLDRHIENALVFCLDVEICSALYMLPCKVKCGGDCLSGAYLYALATNKKHRGRGYMSALIERAHEKNFDCFLLRPANGKLAAFYEKSGYKRDAFTYNAARFTPDCGDDTAIPVDAAFVSDEMKKSGADGAVYDADFIDFAARFCDAKLLFSNGCTAFCEGEKIVFLSGAEYEAAANAVCRTLSLESAELIIPGGDNSGGMIRCSRPIEKKLFLPLTME